MNVENIEIVTIIVVLLFLIPVLWNLYNSRIFKKFTYIESIKVLNKSTKIQGFVALVLIPFSWIWNKFEFIFDYLISDVYFTYVVVGIFMYLPSLAFLNLNQVNY